MPISDTTVDLGWFDSHCHLNDIAERHIALQAARAQGIASYVIPGTQPSQWPDVLRAAQSRCFAAVGIHPWYVNGERAQFAALRQALTNHAIVAIGEIGLDFFQARQPRPSKPLQLAAFEQQLALAQQFSLPVIIHSVKAHQETLALLKTIPVKAVVHAFVGSVEMAEQYLNLGCYLGIGPQLFRSTKLQRAVQQAPREQLLLETDAPYMTPKDSKNPLLTLIDVGRLVAELKSIEVEVLQRQTTTNALAFFNLE